MPLPQQGPQSFGQVLHVSPRAGSHVPLPQQVPQSLGQVVQLSSLGSQTPFPHAAPEARPLTQSVGQLLQSSPSSQVPSESQGPHAVPQLESNPASQLLSLSTVTVTEAALPAQSPPQPAKKWPAAGTAVRPDRPSRIRSNCSWTDSLSGWS